MLLVDYREGSKDLLKPLLAAGLPAEEADIDADIAFVGRGEGGKPVDVGIEFKKLGECVAAMRTERLQGLQVPRMCRVYDFRYLMVEGEMLFNQRGLLLRRAGRRNFKPMPGAMTASEFLKRVYVLHLRGGMNFLHTQTRKETVKYIEALYRTWTDEDLDKHKSHIGAYQPPTPIPVSEFRQAVMKWPGIGFKASGAVEKHFNGSLRRAVLASVAEWASITTVDDRGHSRRLGESVAERIVSFMEGK